MMTLSNVGYGAKEHMGCHDGVGARARAGIGGGL